MRAVLLSLIFLSLAWSLQAQKDYNWWNMAQNWDGITHWDQYLTIAPGFMGPNALPVPDVQTGRLEQEASMRLEVEQFITNGENDKLGEYTISFPLRFYYPFSDKIAVQLFGVPFEYYKTDTLTRDTRAARDRDAEGPAGGDLYFGTIIQLIRDRGSWPDLTFEMVGKTASGNNFDNARFTDSPGYYFDLGFGRKFRVREKSHWAWFGMLGFYSWQTPHDEYRQNDALLWGGGILHSSKTAGVKLSTGGYNGYLIGDDPLVSRLEVILKRKRWNTLSGFQLGWQDQPTFAVNIGWEYKLNISK